MGGLYVHIWGVCVYVSMCRPGVNMNAGLSCSSPYFRQGLALDLEIADLARLTGCNCGWTLTCLPFRQLWALNSGAHNCMVNTINELSSQCKKFIFFILEELWSPVANSVVTSYSLSGQLRWLFCLKHGFSFVIVWKSEAIFRVRIIWSRCDRLAF